MCVRLCETKLCGQKQEPAQCHKRHACHAECKWMSPSATPAGQSEGRCHQVPHAATMASNGTQARHQNQPSARSATLAAQNDDRLSKWCVSKWCVSEWCVSISVGELCVSKLCVCE